MFDFFQIAEVVGTEGGISLGYLAPTDWFTTIEEAPSTGTNAGDTATIADAHTFVSSPTAHGWLKFQVIPGKEGNFKMATEGEYPNQKTKTSFMLQMVGLNAAQVEFAKQSKNRRFIALIADGNCGNESYWNIGCKCRPVILTQNDYDSDTNIWTVSGEAMCAPALYTDTATIPLEA
jgi:hypothetical protein